MSALRAEAARWFAPYWLVPICSSSGEHRCTRAGAWGWMEKSPFAVLVVGEGEVRAFGVDGALLEVEELYARVPGAREAVRSRRGAR